MGVTVEEERKWILDNFQRSMQKYQGKRIAIYGLGVNTEHIVTHQRCCNIVALMDLTKEGEIYWGLPVISKEQALSRADVVVIVARSQSVPIIYERIADLEDSGITIIDVLGEKVNLDSVNTEIKHDAYFERSYEDLLAEIERHEVITFDIFDTLIMRKILLPEHIYQITERVWNERHPEEKVKFAQYRIQAEKNANEKYGTPTYEQIYDELQTSSFYSTENCEELKKIEYETEMQYIVPREVMVQALEKAWSMGKKVYCISDMYYSTSQIEGFLKKCGIRHYHGMVVSCEAGCGKWPIGKLFQYTMGQYHFEPKQVLHIGDNYAADIESAGKCGIDTFYIWNAKKMLESSYLRKILVHVRSLEDAVIVGMYMSKALNDPFSLSKGKGRFCIPAKEMLGYIGYGGMITAYLYWILKKYSLDDTDKILFLARDGYLLERVYQKILKEKKLKNAPKGIYVLASRRCLAGAAIYNGEDLMEQAGGVVDIDVPAGELLKMRFGVVPKPEDNNAHEILNGEELREYLMTYQKEIIEESQKERNNFLEYLHSLGIWYENENDILIDSETSGTCAYYYRKTTKTNAKLACIVLIKIPEWSHYDKDIDEGFLDEDMANFEKRAYTRCTHLNDSILTSPEEQLIKIDDNGKPVFSDMKEKNFENIKEVQKGIEDFCCDYIRLTPYSINEQEISVELVDGLVGLLISDAYIWNQEWKKDFFIIEQFSGKVCKQNFFQENRGYF